MVLYLSQPMLAQSVRVYLISSQISLAIYNQIIEQTLIRLLFDVWSITQFWHFVERKLWIQINNYLVHNLWQYTSYGILILWLDMITVKNLRLDMITVNRAGTTGGCGGVTPPSPKGKSGKWAHNFPGGAPECWYCGTCYIYWGIFWKIEV
jgi:hypothetical protein